MTVHMMYRPGSNQHMIFVLYSPSLLSLFLLDLETFSFLMCHMCQQMLSSCPRGRRQMTCLFNWGWEIVPLCCFCGCGAALIFAFCTTLLTPAACAITIVYFPWLSGGLFLGREVFWGKLTVGWRALLKRYAFFSEAVQKQSLPHIVSSYVAPGSYDIIIFMDQIINITT